MILEKLTPHLLYQFNSEQELMKAIEELSLKFTKERENIGDYLKDERLVSAYTAFYLTTNMPKLASVLHWMPQEWIQEILNCDLIDLGAGPGTFSLAWKERGASGNVYQIEKSPVMRSQASKLWKAFYPESPLYQSSRWEWQSSGPKLLLFGHSVNEMGADLAIQYIESIQPDHILFIEPGTKEFFPVMLEVRNYLLSKKFSVLFPCPTEKECPMKGSGVDWCHQFIQVSQDEEVQRLSQLVRKDRRLLPLTVHAYSKSFTYPNPRERVVRVRPETKFSFEWEVCHENQLEHYQIMKRGFSKAEIKDLAEVLSGASLESEVEKSLEGSKRVIILSLKK